MQFHFLHSDVQSTQPSWLIPSNASLLRQIVALYQHEGWWHAPVDTDALLLNLINNSHCFLIAVSDNQDVVAMGRAISDRTSDAYIQDVAVRFDHRKSGLGTAIITRIIKRLQSDGITWIGLISEKDSHSFYQKIGFTPLSGAIPMIYRS